MGIVVTLLMLLTLLHLTPLPFLNPIQTKLADHRHSVGVGVLLGGLWNVLWYGLQHLGEYWGNAALVSGVLMSVLSFYLIVPGQLPKSLLRVWLPASRKITALPKAIFLSLLSALAVCAGLYSYTLIRMNLDYFFYS